MFQVVTTDKAPKAIGPYSQATMYNGFIFVSGQIPLDPKTGQLIVGPVAEQTRQVMNNLATILEAAGSNLARVIKTTVYLKDMQDFEEMNKVYGEFFSGPKPARATVQVARLPRDVSVEIDAIAVG
ncbi:MAG TPA: RidA family protein [Candidatus Obscuribacterales bacterium]